MKEAIKYFEGYGTVECADCHKNYDHTCSGADASKCNAYRKAIKALNFVQEVTCKEPLTLNELKRSVGKPVWLVTCNGGHWIIADGAMWCEKSQVDNYGTTWVTYRCDPNMKL